VAPADPSLEQQVARGLAMAREPLLATELHQQLGVGSPFRRSDVIDVLRSSSLFVPNGTRWQLGLIRGERET
jgi:hypothetical protein